MIDLVRKIARPIRRMLMTRQSSGVLYWEQRARRYGRRSVLNINHSDAEFDSVTRHQQQVIFPYLRKALRGDEKLILDFGCGPGRFTAELASIIAGNAIGVDPIKHLLDMAPQHPSVEYKVMTEGQISLPDDCVDVVWICLVLGGIPQLALTKTILEIQRVLKKGGLLFVIENTSSQPSAAHWTLRPITEYKNMFLDIDLEHLDDYFDADECISIMAGRKSR